MKATLVIVENDRDHQQAKALVEKLMDSTDPSDQARLIVQARLIEAYEQSRWPRRAPALPQLLTYGRTTDGVRLVNTLVDRQLHGLRLGGHHGGRQGLQVPGLGH